MESFLQRLSNTAKPATRLCTEPELHFYVIYPIVFTLFISLLTMADWVCELLFNVRTHKSNHIFRDSTLGSIVVSFVLIAYYPPQPFLVCVETNPGPEPWHTIDMYPLPEGWYDLVITCSSQPIVRFVQVRPGFRISVPHDPFWFQCAPGTEEERFDNLVHQFKNFTRSDWRAFLWNWWRQNHQGYLVGVETNPGPDIKAPASRPKGAKMSNFLQRQLEREHAKKTKIRNVKTQDRFYEPQGFSVDHNLPADTKAFLAQVIAVLKDALRDGVNINIDLGIKSTFREWWEVFVKAFDSVKARGLEILRALFAFAYRCLMAVLPRSIQLWIIHTGVGFMDYLEGELEMEDEYEAQGGLSTAAFATVAAGFYRKSFHTVFGDRDPIGFIGLMTKMSKATTMFSTIYESVLSVLREIINALNHWFDFKLPMPCTGTASRLFSTYYELRDALKQPDPDRRELTRRVYILNDAVEFAYRHSLEKSEKENLRWLLQLVQPLVKMCERDFNPVNSMRVPPSAIMIGGPTAVGKSTLTQPSIMAIVMQIANEKQRQQLLENHADFMFYRNTENEYMDGMKPHHDVIVYDDFGQRRDTPGGVCNDAFELLRMKNNAPMHLHMSAVEDKQKHYANPKMIFGTTNRNKMDFPSIHCSEAIIRRFDVSVIQVPKLEYCLEEGLDRRNPWTRRFDFEKLRMNHPFDPENEASYVVLDAVEYIEWDFYRGCAAKRQRVWDFSSFIQHCVEVHKKVRTEGEKQVKFVDYIKRSYADPNNIPKLSLKKFEQEIGDIEPQGGLSDYFWGPSDELVEDVDFNMSGCKNADERWQRFLENARIHVSPAPKFAYISRVCAAIGAAIAIVWGARALYKWFSPQPEGYSSGKNPTIKKADRVRRARMHVRAAMPSDLEPQSGSHDSEMFNQMYKLLGRNLYRFHIKGFDPGTDRELRVEMGMALFVCGKYALWPDHFESMYADFSKKYEGVTVELSSLDDVVKAVARLEELEYMRIGDYDLVLNKIPGIRDHANILGMLDVPERDGDVIKCYLPVFRGTESCLAILSTSVLVRPSSHETYGEGEWKSRAISYSAPTVSGDCGAPLFTFDKRFGGTLKILGFHVAGTRIGFSQACLGVKPILALIKSAIHEFEDPMALAMQEDTEFVPQGALHGFSLLGQRKAPVMPRKSKIEPSPFHGKLWDITTKPCKLTPFEYEGRKIDPGMIAKVKYNKVPVHVPEDILHDASRIVNKRIMRRIVQDPWQPRVFSAEEAIRGIPGVEFCGGIDRSTSAGYPLNLKKSGKSYWLGATPEIDFTTPGCKELLAMVGKANEAARKGVRLDYIFMDCLKDERKPVDKVMAGKTRQFMAGPMVLTILMKMYFGDFVRRLRANRIVNGSAVGISYTCGEWDTLAQHLVPNSNYRCSAGDMSGFDTSILVPYQLAFLELCEVHYVGADTGDRLARRTLFQEVINSKHIDRDGNVYEFVGKTPSGIFLTADINSYICALELVSVWLHNGIPSDTIENEFRWTTFGDDHGTGFPAEYEDKAGAIAMKKGFMDLLAITYTDEAKGDNMCASKSLEEITFLKRSFRRVKGKYVAPLDLGVLKETLNWQKNTSPEYTFCQRIDCWLVELARHGNSVFELHAPKVILLARELLDYESMYSTYDLAVKCDTYYADFE